MKDIANNLYILQFGIQYHTDFRYTVMIFSFKLAYFPIYYRYDLYFSILRTCSISYYFLYHQTRCQYVHSRKSGCGNYGIGFSCYIRYIVWDSTSLRFTLFSISLVIGRLVRHYNQNESNSIEPSDKTTNCTSIL